MPVFKVGVISGIGWLLDFIIYVTLVNFTENIYLSNMFGSISGLCFTFTFGLKVGFNNNNNPKIKYILFYLTMTLLVANGLSLFLDFLVNSQIVNFISGKFILIVPSFLFNYLLLKCINYFIQKN